MAKFCGNCGMQLEDDARICGNCGTPYMSDGEKNRHIAPHTKKKIKKIAIFGVVGIVVIIIGIVSLNIFSYMTGYERTINTFVEGLSEYDIDKVLSVSCNAGLSVDSSYDYEEAFSSMVSTWLDNYESQVGHDVKLSCEIQDSYKLSDRKLQVFLTNLEDIYKYDTGDISEIVCAEVKLIISGSRSEKTFPAEDIYMIKENGKWGVYIGSTSFISSSNSSSSSNYNSLFN